LKQIGFSSDEYIGSQAPELQVQSAVLPEVAETRADWQDDLSFETVEEALLTRDYLPDMQLVPAEDGTQLMERDAEGRSLGIFGWGRRRRRAPPPPPPLTCYSETCTAVEIELSECQYASGNRPR